MKFKERVFSGMQPTGRLHLGNYLGAMVNWIALQKTHECIYCVVDMHAITVWQDPDDQKQHLELARDIAQKFNSDFRPWIEKAGHADGAFFPLPEPVITGPATRVMSLRDGTKKMSKSDPSDLSRINLTDDADTIAKKIQKAKTDPEPLPSEAKGLETRPEAENPVGIYAALAGTAKEDVLKEFGG